MVIAWAPRWEKKEKKIGVVEKKIGKPSEPRGILAEGERSARSDGRYIFFLIWSCFLFAFFPHCGGLVSGHMATTDFKLGEIKKKLESSEAYLLNLGSWAFEVIYIFCKNTVWNLICQ